MRKNLRKWILLLLAGLFILSCFFVSPEKFSVESDLPIFLNFSFLYYFPLEKYFYMATILILSSYLLESRVLSYIAYPILRFAKTRKALSHILIFLSFGIALLFGTSISMFFTLPLSAITLGKEEDSPYLFMHTVCLQILAAELGSILFPFTSLSDFYLFLQFNYSFTDYLRISFPFFFSSILFLLPYVYCFHKEKNRPLSLQTLDRLQSSYEGLKERSPEGKVHRFSIPLGVFSTLFFLSCIRLIPIYLVTVLLLLYSLFFRREVFLRLDYFLLGFVLLIFLLRGNILTMHLIPRFLSTFISGKECSHSLVLAQIFTRLPAAVFLADWTTKGRQLIMASILSSIHPLAWNYSGVIAYSMMKNRPHGKVFILHYIFLHIQMLLLLVFLAFFTGNL